jgi:hypothetical protein
VRKKAIGKFFKKFLVFHGGNNGAGFAHWLSRVTKFGEFSPILRLHTYFEQFFEHSWSM